MYHNEGEVGSAVLSFIGSPSSTSSLKREDIHFTSKLASNTSYDAARKSIKKSVKQSGLGHIDLFLLHSPYGGKAKRLECWKAVEDAIEDGEVRTGGVSNFGVKHVRLMLSLDHLFCLYFACSAAGAPSLEASSTPSCQPDRGAPIQHAHRDHLVLPGAQHHCRSLRSSSSSAADEAPHHHIAVQEVLLHTSSAHDPMELTAWLCASSQERHKRANHCQWRCRRL